MMKKFKPVPTYVLNWFNELEPICTKEFGYEKSEYGPNRFELLEANNDSAYNYFNMMKKPHDDGDQEQLKVIRTSGSTEYHNLPIILQELINLEIIPEGNYSIEVRW